MFFDFYMAFTFVVVIFFIWKFFKGEKEDKIILMLHFSVIVIAFLIMGITGETNEHLNVNEPISATQEIMIEMTAPNK